MGRWENGLGMLPFSLAVPHIGAKVARVTAV